MRRKFYMDHNGMVQKIMGFQSKKLSSRIKNEKVIIITGTPGVGKTTISEILATRIGAKMISIGHIVEEERLFIGIDKKREIPIADIDKIKERLIKIISLTEELIIVEGHYSIYVIPQENVQRAFVLRKNPENLNTILRDRGYKEQKIRENLAAEILDVCLYDAVSYLGIEKTCEIDVTGKDITEIVKLIILTLEEKEKCKLGVVDWIEKLENKGKLDFYLQEF